MHNPRAKYTQELFAGYMSIPVGSVQLTDMCCVQRQLLMVHHTHGLTTYIWLVTN